MYFSVTRSLTFNQLLHVKRSLFLSLCLCICHACNVKFCEDSRYVAKFCAPNSILSEMVVELLVFAYVSEDLLFNMKPLKTNIAFSGKSAIQPDELRTNLGRALSLKWIIIEQSHQNIQIEHMDFHFISL